MNRLLALLLFSVAKPRSASGANLFQGVSSTNLPWPGGIVPYVFQTNVTTLQREVYLAALREWELAANVHFVARTDESHYALLKLQILPDGSELTSSEFARTVAALRRAFWRAMPA